MNDDDLGRFLQRSLHDRCMPEDARARVLARLRARPWRWAAAAAAASLVLAVGAALLLRSGDSLPARVRAAFEHHRQSDVKEHAVSSATPREMAERVRDTTGRDVLVPGLRDAGFPKAQAYQCGITETAHVVYQNSWTKLSCFIFEAHHLDLSGGERVSDRGIEGTVFRTAATSAVAVREGGLVKLWVSDLRPEQVVAIAFDAEQKRYQLKTAVFAVTCEHDCRPVETILSGTPGVEQVQRGATKGECVVKYDPRRVSPDEITAVLLQSDMDVTPMPDGGR